MDQRDVDAGTALVQGHSQHVEHERGAHVVGQLPADHAARPRAEHEREEHDAVPAAQIREVGHPELVRAPAVKSRSTRCARRRAAGSGRVVRHGLPRRLAPRMRCARISLSTVQRAIGSPPAAARPTYAWSRRRSSWRHATPGCGPAAAPSRAAGANGRRSCAGKYADADTPKVRQIGSTPKRPRCSSTNAVTSVGLGRAPWRKTPTPI